MNEAVSVRQMGFDDLTDVVSIHMKAFPSFFMTKLGKRFLRRYYGLTVQFGLALVAVCSNSRVCGFAVGYPEPERFYKIMRDSKISFALDVLLSMKPETWVAALRATASYSGSKEVYAKLRGELGNSLVELASIAVDPEFSNKGIGKELLKEFIVQAQLRGKQMIYLTTDLKANDKVLQFYKKNGFKLLFNIEKTPGRPMAVLLYTVDGYIL